MWQGLPAHSDVFVFDAASLDDSDIECPSRRETEVNGDRPSLDLCSRSMEDALDAADFG